MVVLEPLHHDVRNVGKVISSSKKKYTWLFRLDGTEHIVEFYKSKKGNRRIFMNNDKVYDTVRSEGDIMSYRFEYRRDDIILHCNILKVSKGQYDLRVGNISFRDS